MRDAAKGEDVGAIQRATEALQKAAHAMAEQLYKQQAATGPAHAGARDQSEDNVKDGEVVDA